MSQKNLLLSGLTLFFIGAYFIALTKDAVLCYFSPDDCMTIYRSWANPAGALLKANLLFFLNSVFYRPMGSVWYRTMFDIAGFNPVPFHISNLCTLAVNIWLTYCVVRRLTRSREVGALAALLISYHGFFICLYFDTGYIYDVVCYFFYFSTLLFYLRVRSRPRPPRWWELVVFSALYICALNAKEMALTMPAILAAYEWLYQRESLGPMRNLWRWATTYGRGVLVAGLLVLAFVIGRATTGEGLLANPAFQPVFSWARFMETSRNFVSQLLFRNNLPSAVVLLILLSLFVIAWASKSRALKFAWLFLMLSAIPVDFIPPRGPGQYYVTLFGWVLYAATALVEGTKRLFRNLPGHEKLAPVRPLLLFLGAAGLMYYVNKPHAWTEVSAVAMEGEELRSIVDQVHQLRPTLRRASRVLFLNDPIDEQWRIMYLMRLSYRDNDLVIDRAKFMKEPPTAGEIASYDYVFDYRHGHFSTSPLPEIHGPQPEVVYEWGHPALFHSDWTRITPQHPARRGEAVISMMADLGDTTTPLPHDKPFPSSPFLEVASPVEVRVDGQPAEVMQKIGWPEMVNRYRVDFRIPEKVRTGEPEVVVTRGGDTGLPTPIAVR